MSECHNKKYKIKYKKLKKKYKNLKNKNIIAIAYFIPNNNSEYILIFCFSK